MSLSSTAAHSPVDAGASSELEPSLSVAIESAQQATAPYLGGEVAGRDRLALSLGVVLDESGGIVQGKTKVIGRQTAGGRGDGDGGTGGSGGGSGGGDGGSDSDRGIVICSSVVELGLRLTYEEADELLEFGLCGSVWEQRTRRSLPSTSTSTSTSASTSASTSSSSHSVPTNVTNRPVSCLCVRHLH